MCGIAGIVKYQAITPDDRDIVARMIAQLRHRGPDESGMYLDPDVCLGHARLRIVGLNRGTQPIGNPDRSLWIIYNGETFNYIELKNELIGKGYRFETDTDTEVVLRLYEAYGENFLKKINGQFALAIWDTRKKELFLARDRTGIQPLFYTCQRGQFCFASEIKALFAVPDIPRQIAPESLSQIFTFWTTLTPHTAFKDIFELPPGHFTRVTEQGVSPPQVYWDIPHFTADHCWKYSFDEATEALQELVTDAVRLRLRADVPVGAYLSGGLDSSILTALTVKNFDNQLQTFSLSFQEDSFDESTYQNRLRHVLKTRHSEIRISHQDIRENLPRVIRQCETPLVRTGPIPLFLLSREVRNHHFKVVLTGEGADELFGGYHIYKENKLRHFCARQPNSQWRPMLLACLYPYIFRDNARARIFLQHFFSVKTNHPADPYFSHQIRWRNSSRNRTFFSRSLQERLNGYDPLTAVAQRIPKDFAGYDPFSKAQFLEMEIFLSNYLLSSQGDRVGMANSIELRLPFLDHRIIEFAAGLPAHWKIRGLNEKYILKETFKKWIPEMICKRPKQPYRAPVKEAFPTDDTTDAYIHDLLSEDTIRSYGYFDPRKVSLLRNKFRRASHQSANEVHNMALVGILSTQLLHQQFVEQFKPETVVPQPRMKMITAT
jgi:asparagine synthase (glutamine-hydrolysing)